MKNGARENIKQVPTDGASVQVIPNYIWWGIFFRKGCFVCVYDSWLFRDGGIHAYFTSFVLKICDKI